MKARKPEAFRVNDTVAAECAMLGDGTRFVTARAGYLYAADTTRLAAWLTEAAAWCREGGK